MGELIKLRKQESQEIAVTTSLMVAEKFGKQHRHVLQSIEKLQKDVPKNGPIFFVKGTYSDEYGRKQPMYYMNRDAFSLLVMGFTGKKALEWKVKYIEAFNQMEAIITEKSTAAWIETRQKGILTRKSEADVIKELVEYAKEQGSENSQMLYVTYTKLANAMAGIEKRDKADTTHLNNLGIFENLIRQMILNGMDAGLNYKQIYKVCKERCAAAKEIAMIG